MWNKTTSYLKESCANTGAFGPGDSQAQIDAMYDSIVKVSEASLVDPRFIFATILQESSGCVNIDTSKNPDPSQPDNPYVFSSSPSLQYPKVPFKNIYTNTPQAASCNP
jgi:hypothetical protein